MDNDKLDLILTKLDKIDERLDRIEGRLDRVEADNHSMKLQLENEIVRNVQIIAEGHLDLSRKLQEAVKATSAVEMLQVQVNILQGKVRDLERKLEEKMSA